jgi:hypothetical protein
MDNLFVGLNDRPALVKTNDQAVRRLFEKGRKQKRDAMYAKYTPMVYNVLDQLIAAYRPGVWKKGSDSDHEFCCHCRWYAGPEETGHAHYGDHAIRRRIEIELDTDDQCNPTGFKVHFYDNPGMCIHVGLTQDELVSGIKAVFG